METSEKIKEFVKGIKNTVFDMLKPAFSLSKVPDFKAEYSIKQFKKYKNSQTHSGLLTSYPVEALPKQGIPKKPGVLYVSMDKRTQTLSFEFTNHNGILTTHPGMGQQAITSKNLGIIPPLTYPLSEKNLKPVQSKIRDYVKDKLDTFGFQCDGVLEKCLDKHFIQATDRKNTLVNVFTGMQLPNNITLDSIATALQNGNKQKANRTIITNRINELKRLTAFIKQHPGELSPIDVASYLQSIQSKLRTAIEETHVREQNHLVTYLKEHNINENQRAIYLNKLSEHHTNELKALNKDLEPFKADIKEGQMLAQKEMDRIAFLNRMCENNDSSKNKLKEFMRNKGIDPDNIPQGEDYKDVELEDFEALLTVTGRTITHDKANKTFSISLAMPLLGLHPYYWFSSKNVEADIASLVDAIQKDNITIKITHYDTGKDDQGRPTQEEAMELGRKSYEAAMRTGRFDPEKIVIVVNGTRFVHTPKPSTNSNEKEQSFAELFGSEALRYQQAQKSNSEYQKQIDKMLLQTDEETTTFKQKWIENQQNPNDQNNQMEVEGINMGNNN